MSLITENRKKIYYRLFEASLGLFSFSFIIILVVLAFVSPEVLSIFLIIYSFFMVLKVSIHGVYTVYTYKNLVRWEAVDWPKLLKTISRNRQEAKKIIQNLADNHNYKLDWQLKLKNDLEIFDSLKGTKFAQPKNIFQFPLFAVYNESSEVIMRSLRGIYESGYDLDKIIVFVSQEARIGKKHNKKIFKEIESLDWIKAYDISEENIDIAYNSDHYNLKYKNKKFKKLKIIKNKLNVVFTQHPDGLVGEIKGKASNEDWGARQISLFTKAQEIDPEICIITSLDADSKVGENFFHMLSFRYCLTPDRFQAGFQPLPIYTNNFFTANLFPRLVASNTTIWHMILYSLLDELHFFANYSVPLVVLQKVDFWVREVIAEDNLLFIKCLTTFNGDFRVVPFYGVFEGDAVYGEDYIEAIGNQYRQLQRWAWGGIEGLPYKLQRFFVDPKGVKTDLRKRIRYTFQEFINHFYWATSPIIFGVIIFLPRLVGGIEYQDRPASVNLWLFSQYFAWLSFVFLFISSYITFRYITLKALNNFQPKWYHWIVVSMQWIVAPMLFVAWGPPALDAQVRGLLGKYLGYWVTPKK